MRNFSDHIFFFYFIGRTQCLEILSEFLKYWYTLLIWNLFWFPLLWLSALLWYVKCIFKPLKDFNFIDQALPLLKEVIIMLGNVICNIYHLSWKVFLNFFLSLSGRTLSHVDLFESQSNSHMWLRFRIACFVLKLKYIAFTVRLQGHSVKFNFITVYGKNNLQTLMISYDFKHIETDIYITDER